MYAVCVASIKFHKFPLAGKHFNFLGICVGSSKNSVPNKLISILKVSMSLICYSAVYII